MTPDRNQNMNNALRLCYNLTHSPVCSQIKCKSVLSNVNWVYKFFGLSHGFYNLRIKT